MKNKTKKEKIGGMALFNGLLLRSAKKESVTEIKEGKIEVKENTLYEVKNVFSIKKVPILRGIVNLSGTITSSIPYIMKSAESVLQHVIQNEEGEVEIDTFELTCSYAIAITIILAIFTAIPNLVSTFFTYSLQNIVQCGVQFILFVIYLLLISKIRSLGALFEYHGAEHKVVNAYEHLAEEEITVENVKKESRFHNRCGGNFIVYLFLLIMITTLFLPSTNLLIKTVIQIALIPVLIGISYELVMLMASLPGFLKILSYPAMAIQFITTQEPTEDKIQLAIYGLWGCVKEDTSCTVSDYLKRYQKRRNLTTEYMPIQECLRVVSYVHHQDKDLLFANMEQERICYQEQITLDRLLDQVYVEKIPLQYVLGEQEFYHEIYEVTSDVLIPRADTEILVEQALTYIEQYELKQMVDICTGSGCIAISIAKHSSIEKVFASDISKKAIEVAIRNVERNHVQQKVYPLVSDLAEVWIQNHNTFDLVVSNPPYIKSEVIPTLAPEVQKEPKLALDGGKSGLEIYSKLLEQASDILNDNGFLMLEIGFDQKEALTKIITNYPKFELMDTVQDLGGNDRVMICRFHQM